MIDEKVKNDINNLKNNYLNLPLFQEYFRLKNLIKISKTLQNSDKIIILSNYQTLKNEEKKIYGRIKLNSSNDPLLYNFFEIKEQVEDFKEEINYLLKLWFMQF